MKKIADRFIIFCTIAFVQILFAASIDSQIDNTKKEFDSKKQSERQLYLKLDQVADDIKSKQTRLFAIEKEIQDLENEIKQESQNEKALREELQSLEKKSQDLESSKQNLESRMIDLIAKDFSLAMILSQSNNTNIDAVISNESLEVLSKVVNKEFYTLKKEYNTLAKEITLYNKNIESTKQKIQKLDQNRIALAKLKDEQENSIAKLKKVKTRYLNELARVQNEQKSLNQTLKKLNILKEEEERKAAEELAQQQQKEQELLEQRTAKIDDEAEKLKVRQVGSSYQSTKVIRYKGQKTIAPLESFKVVRSFGPYVDPVYNIKIFNESLILGSQKRNSKVRTVLNGKVIFAEETALLKNVVIVEHKGAIHTIYAGLSQIAPTIKKGQKIKKGYTVGRIDDELVFQVTQKSYYIDPKDLITLN